jgi:hypothetical protein
MDEYMIVHRQPLEEAESPISKGNELLRDVDPGLDQYRDAFLPVAALRLTTNGQRVLQIVLQ